MDGYLEMGAVAGAAAAAKGRDGGYVENPRKQGAGEDAYMETAPPEVIFWGELPVQHAPPNLILIMIVWLCRRQRARILRQKRRYVVETCVPADGISSPLLFLCYFFCCISDKAPRWRLHAGQQWGMSGAGVCGLRADHEPNMSLTICVWLVAQPAADTGYMETNPPVC